MEIPVNKEIRDYQESIYFGLSVRQFLFSAAAVGAAVLVYFLLHEAVGTETVSWVCVLCAAPLAAMGFFRYHGMTFERFAWAWIKAEILMPRRLHFRAENYYYETLRNVLEDESR